MLVDFVKKNKIEDWYGLYMNKHKVGYLTQKWYFFAPKKQVIHYELFHMEMKVLGQVKIMNISSETFFT